MKENDIDEDLIPGYKCRVCGHGTCRGDAFEVDKDNISCVCIDCSMKEGEKK